MKKLLLIITLLSVGNSFSNIEKIKSCASEAGISVTDEQAEKFKGCVKGAFMSHLAAKYPMVAEALQKAKGTLISNRIIPTEMPGEMSEETPILPQ